MAKYEPLPITTILPSKTRLEVPRLPEIVHLEDPATLVMMDFGKTIPHTITPEDTMDQAIHEMEASHSHLLLVLDKDGHLQGILTSQDVWGEKPIKIIQERRIHRDQIRVQAIMTPIADIIGLDAALLQTISVGHIVKTLTEHHKQHALVLKNVDNAQNIQGIFILSQIRKRLPEGS